MKTNVMIRSALWVVASTLPVWADVPSLDWFTMDGGGGHSSGAGFSLTGTVGQPDAGATMSGGTYSLTGGFWTVFSAPESIPTLSIELGADGTAIISWIPKATGYLLQETPQLTTPQWQNTADAAANPQFVPATSTTRYYRLQKP